MKSKEELIALKEEVETLNKKLHALSEEELQNVVGGAKQPSEPAGEGMKWYQILPDDTLIKIARKFDTDYKNLAKLNNIADLSQIRPGQWIRVPA